MSRINCRHFSHAVCVSWRGSKLLYDSNRAGWNTSDCELGKQCAEYVLDNESQARYVASLRGLYRNVVVSHRSICAGSQVVLRIVDSDGNSGGSGPIYTISGKLSIASNNCVPYLLSYPDGPSDCLKTDTSSSFTISTNGTDTLNTCDPWGIRLTGGTPPYTINFVAPNSPSATNVTTLGNDDAYTYINRAAPDDVLIGLSCLPIPLHLCSLCSPMASAAASDA